MVKPILGDLIVVSKVLYHVCKALIEAKEDFLEIAGDINAFCRGLEIVERRFQSRSETRFDAKGVKDLNDEIRRAKEMMDTFRKKLEPYHAALSKRPPSEKPPKPERVWGRCRWITMGREVKRARERINAYRASIGFMAE